MKAHWCSGSYEIPRRSTTWRQDIGRRLHLVSCKTATTAGNPPGTTSRTVRASQFEHIGNVGTMAAASRTHIPKRWARVAAAPRSRSDQPGLSTTRLEKSLSFELYRRSIMDVEAIPFDESCERTVFIIQDIHLAPCDLAACRTVQVRGNRVESRHS